MRIAIVNDLNIAIESLRRIILSVPGHEIAWTARDGSEAVKKNAMDPPDLILMDLIMPIMDGVEATRRIMIESPPHIPRPLIVVVTATIGNNAGKVFEAMGYGALDAVNIPMMGRGAEAERSRYILLRKIHVIAKLRGLASHATNPPPLETDASSSPIVVMGSSTGGPKALAKILSGLPKNFEAIVAIVQHVDEKFSAGLADWLAAQTMLPVKLAAEGEQPEPGKIYLAGTNEHLIVTPRMTFSYTPAGNTAYRPSVDVFFNSVAKNWKVDRSCRHKEKNSDSNDDGICSCIAAILTGMGKDGAKGLFALREAGWYTIAQDEKTSVIYGMPKAAKIAGAVVKVLPINNIAPIILHKLGY